MAQVAGRGYRVKGIVLISAVFAVTSLVSFDGEVSAQASCTGARDRLWTTDTLHDWVSFSDQLSVIEVLDEQPVDGAGAGEAQDPGDPRYVGRDVTVRVESRLWHRAGAPIVSGTLRLRDWGWCRTGDDLRPIRIETATRLRVGQRYLAPLTTFRGAWSAQDDGRLRLRGNLIVGGVDAGVPTFAHQALSGLRLHRAAAVVRRTRPYRAAVRLADQRPDRRWNAVDRDDYELAGANSRRVPWTVAAGSSRISRWALFARRAPRRRLCVGIEARPLWRAGPTRTRETCGAQPTRARLLTVGDVAATDRGVFAYGAAYDDVAWIEVTFPNGRRARVASLPSPTPLGGRGRFWVVRSRTRCGAMKVRALDRQGRTLARAVFRSEAPPSSACRGSG